MDKIKKLRERRDAVKAAGKGVRADISALCDEGSFVEFSTFSFSKSDFYPEGACGEGVVAGFVTIDGYPFYVVAQNGEVLGGGVSEANCNKIMKCLSSAEKSGTPVVYILNSKGVRVGEGVNVLEGLAGVLLKAAQLKGSVLQFCIVNGEVYGQIAALAGICDFNFFIKDKSVLAANSPLVIAAKSGVNSPAKEIGGAAGLAKTNLMTFSVSSMAEVREKIISVASAVSPAVIDSDELNVTVAELDSAPTAENILKLFDNGGYAEIGAPFAPDVKCVLGRMGGVACAAVIFDGEEGVKLNARKVKKIKDFAELACCRELPLVFFVNCIGLCPCLNNHDSLVLKEVAELINVLDCCDKKLSVISGKAVGLGYTLFAAKNMGYDYTLAFANAKVALFDGVQGAEIELAGESGDKKSLAERYGDENSDPINAAKNGYIDNIIEPAFAKQYIVSCLQTLVN